MTCYRKGFLILLLAAVQYFSLFALPLFDAFPSLSRQLAHVVLADVPTPILQCDALAKQLGIARLYIKQDGMTGLIDSRGVRQFGGNKVRKLEFLIADALANGANTVITFGCVGSNHVVATASCAQQAGLSCVALLKPQPHSPVVERNLLLDKYYGAQMRHYPSVRERLQGCTQECMQVKNETGTDAYVIPTGGSNRIGACGFVNASFELKEQIAAGAIECPDVVYVATGSMGTYAGLILGMRLAGLDSELRAISVDSASVERMEEVAYRLTVSTNEYLHECDAEVPLFEWSRSDFRISGDFAGDGYGVATELADQATSLASEYAGVVLDPTYSSKAFSAVLGHAQQGLLAGKRVLFWNTFCAETPNVVGVVGRHDLADEFQHYFVGAH